jgi:hypothetical protein
MISAVSMELPTAIMRYFLSLTTNKELMQLNNTVSTVAIIYYNIRTRGSAIILADRRWFFITKARVQSQVDFI